MKKMKRKKMERFRNNRGWNRGTGGGVSIGGALRPPSSGPGRLQVTSFFSFGIEQLIAVECGP